MEMRERIIFAPGAIESEIIKNLAINGVSSINLKIMGACTFARYTLLKSGVAIQKDIITAKEECTVIARAIAGETYFARTSYSDLKKISQAIQQMRSLVVEGNEEYTIKATLKKGIFDEKNQALLKTYQKYVSILEKMNALDSVSLIRMAIAEGKPFEADFEVLSEYPLSPLEKALIEKISDRKVKAITISDLYNTAQRDIKIENFKCCYGAPNEVETILADIYADRKLDKCTVALTDVGTYSQLFFDYALLHDIPVTFGCGVPIINSNPAKLLVLYQRWITDGYFGREAVTAMLYSKAFNRATWRKEITEDSPEVPEGFKWSIFYEVLGGLRLTNDEQVNSVRIKGYERAIEKEEQEVCKSDKKAYDDFCQRKNCIPYLKNAARELSLATEDFICKYAYIHKRVGTNSDILLTKLDTSAVNAIHDELEIIRKTGIVRSTDERIMNVLKMEICKETSEPGKLHITDINGALSSIRENLYIAGLSASKFPGSPKENYLLLDAEITLFGVASDCYTSEGRIKRKREQLLSLVQLASNLGSKTYVSYAGLNVSELKKDNASSLVFELFKKNTGENVTAKDLEEKLEKVDYFTPAISATREIGKAYIGGKKIIDSVVDLSFDRGLEVDPNKSWSPSEINLFFENKQAFIMECLLGISQQRQENPFDVISPLNEGILAHLLMEKLANSNMSRADFLAMSANYYDRYIEMNPPLIMNTVEASRKDFCDMMRAAYDSDTHREVVLKEEQVSCKHPSGVTIHGIPDRVEKLEDGTYLIVDFKTGRNVKHAQDDIYTCIQVILYAYLMETRGFEVSRCEFRYLRLSECVTCVYNEEMKRSLHTVLVEFKDWLKNFGLESIVGGEEETREV